MDNSQLDRNIQTGSEPVTGNHNERPDAPQATPTSTTGLGYQGEFRLAERITLRVTGAGSIEILQAGNPNPLGIADTDLAGLIEDHYFKKLDTPA